MEILVLQAGLKFLNPENGFGCLRAGNIFCFMMAWCFTTHTECEIRLASLKTTPSPQVMSSLYTLKGIYFPSLPVQPNRIPEFGSHVPPGFKFWLCLAGGVVKPENLIPRSGFQVATWGPGDACWGALVGTGAGIGGSVARSLWVLICASSTCCC